MEVLFNHIKRKETDKEELPFPKKAGLISTFTMSNMLPECIALIVRPIHSSDLLDCPLFAIKPPFHPGPADALFQNACILSTSPSTPCWTSPEVSCHGEKCTRIAGLGYTLDSRPKRRALDIQQREKTCRPRHKREGPAAKRWEGLVFSTAECSRGTRTTEKVGMIPRFRRHLPEDRKYYYWSGSRP